LPLRFEPARLTVARELRDLTKTELADRIAVAASDIARIEDGVVKPSAHEAAAIALALGMPLSFFARHGERLLISAENCHFRHFRPSSQLVRRRALALVSVFAEFLAALETRVELPPDRVSGLETSGCEMDLAEGFAMDLRRRWRLDPEPIDDLTQLLESNGVAVLVLHHAFREVLPFSLWHAGRPLVCLSRPFLSPYAARIDAAHELGHLVMHADVAADRRESECEADQFAREFLLPREPFEVECPSHLDCERLLELKERWRVPFSTLLARAFELGKLSEEACARGACLYRNALEKHELTETPLEEPSLPAQALQSLGQTECLDNIARELSISSSDLRFVLEATSSAPSPRRSVRDQDGCAPALG
jgi:Zn-dependent peptidase ImmA (M78 family)/DNA-binding XRE family transcriptional regulator